MESIIRHPVLNIAAEHRCQTVPGILNKPSEIKWFGDKIDFIGKPEGRSPW